MKRSIACLAAALLIALPGCEDILGEEKTPDFVTFQVTGDTGEDVSVVLSTFFNAGTDELGITQVQLGLSDTVAVTIPWDTVVDVRIQRRFFVELSAPATDTASARMVADVDGRQLLNETRDVSADDPFRFIYLFNQFTTSSQIEVF